MKTRRVSKGKNIVTGFDIGGAHLKVARAEAGRIVAAATFATPLWLGLDRLDAGLTEAAALHANSDRLAFTMTGELSDIFRSREAGVAALIDRIGGHFSARDKLVYAGRSGFVPFDRAAGLAAEIASANWHATAALVAKVCGDALFADMGSTTTDLIPIRNGAVAHEGYTDAERLSTGELVYAGFTRSFLFAVAQSAPVRGRLTPLMNEYFASIADVHRILGVLDEADDRLPAADNREKTVTASIARLARVVGRDAAELTGTEWREVARWFSEQQLRSIHDAASRLAHKLAASAPIVGAGIGRWQLARLAERMERRFIDFAGIVPADDAMRREASAAAPAAAIALLASQESTG
jgi:probable H4MPT-linked C1 transfer pathway protein